MIFNVFDLVGILFSWLLWPILIIVLVIYFVRRHRRINLNPANRMFQIAFSREDALSQLYFLLGLGFTGSFLLALNKEIDSPFSWRTIIFLISVLGIYLGYKYKLLFSLAVSIIALNSWWIAQGAVWAGEYNVKAMPILSGLILLSVIMYLLGHLHEQNVKWKRFSLIYRVFSIIFFSGILFFLSTRYGIEIFGNLLHGDSPLASWEIMFLLITFVVSLVVFFILTLKKNLILVPESFAAIIFILFALIILLLPDRSLYTVSSSGLGYSYFYSNREFSPIGMFWAIFFNVGVFLEMLGIILVGYLRKESWHVTLGVVLLFILILVKYFDWFFTTLDKSLFFIGAGALMFVVGWLMERARNRMLGSMLPEVPQKFKNPANV